eukprot:3505173-Rhodomonas_salina.1
MRIQQWTHIHTCAPVGSDWRWVSLCFRTRRAMSASYVAHAAPSGSPQLADIRARLCARVRRPARTDL